MTLSEKILYCRKKSGLSQEALAEILGVSRQSVSKWEIGESVPEISKLPLLASTFGVTSDWLLSEEAPAEPQPAEPAEPKKAEPEASNWVDSIPGVIGKLIRQYGWLYGVYTALAGVGFVVIGTLAKVLTRQMFSDPFGGSSFGGNPFVDNPFGGGETVWYDEAGNVLPPETGSFVESGIESFAVNNPVSTMGTVIIVIGVVLIVAGVSLAVYLKTRKK